MISRLFTMRILTQNLLVVLPVFLATYLFIGGSWYLSAREEMLWSAQNELASFAVAIAEFLDPARPPISRPEAASDSPALPAVENRLLRIFSYGYLRYLAVFPKEGTQACYELGEKPARPPDPFLRNSLTRLRTLAAGSSIRKESTDTVVLSALQPGAQENEPDTMTVLAPVSDGRQNLAAIVFLEKDVSSLSRQSAGILSQLLKMGILVVMAGAAAAGLLSYLVHRPTQRLTSALLACVEGRRDYLAEDAPIREFHGLSNTYNTMVSVLNEAEGRINQNLVACEYFFSNTDLACAFRDAFLRPVVMERESISAVGCMYGNCSRDFLALDAGNGVTWGAVCRLSEPSGETSDWAAGHHGPRDHLRYPRDCDIHSTLSAACFSTLIREELDRGDPQGGLDKVTGLFEVSSFHYIRIHEAAGRCETWSWNPVSRRLERNEEFMPQGVSTVLHTFTGKAAERIEVYTRLFSELHPQQLLQELVRSIGDDLNGSLVIIRLKKPDS
ncbi:MAG: hypothetical protein ACE15F_14865 [bacterium]